MTNTDAAPETRPKTRLIGLGFGVVVFIGLCFIEGFCPFILGILLPYAAAFIFVAGFLYKVIDWARSPVPFRIPTSCGQQKSLPWIRQSKLDNPHTFWGTVARMALEVFAFRSLFRNTAAELRPGPKLVYGSTKFLWAAALAFHWAFLIILIRHTRFFMEPVPDCLLFLQDVDGMFQIGLPVFFATNGLILAGLGYLFLRRVFDAKVRYISLPGDYFAPLLILGIVISGIWMRHFDKVNIIEVKALAMGLMTFSPSLPEGIGYSFYVHLFLVCVLLMYFPFSKLMHMPGVFLSPTRNLANNSRMKRHINPWNYPVKVHTYDEWEDEFRDKMKKAGMPLEKE